MTHMQFKTIAKLIGLLLMMFSTSMLIPIGINLIFGDDHYQPYLLSFTLTFASGLILWVPWRNKQYELKTRDGFLVVSLFWVVLCLFASFPFWLSLTLTGGFTDAMFESVSGFTTTGASVIPDLNKLPHALLYYRQQLQFIGGMGIIVLAVAVLPVLGVGGMQLYRAETPGPIKDAKLTPRITESAKILWMLYLGLGLLCAVSFRLAGMPWFNAIGETFSTISTGGFSMHNSSFGFYHNTHIELIACLFMLLGATNFALHFTVLHSRKWFPYIQDEEFRAFLVLIATGFVFVVTALFVNDYDLKAPAQVFTTTLFNTVSLATTTGLTAAPIAGWPTFASILLLCLALIGGCAASTSGGIKVMRFLLLIKGSKREVIHLIHPHAIHPIKFGNQPLPRQALRSMWGFISVSLGIFILFLLGLLALGNDLITSVSASVAALANVGVGVGQVSSNFATLSLESKWLLIFGMLLGRLEYFSLLVLFTVTFWEK